MILSYTSGLDQVSYQFVLLPLRQLLALKRPGRQFFHGHAEVSDNHAPCGASWRTDTHSKVDVTESTAANFAFVGKIIRPLAEHFVSAKQD
jgi:hypothetical protein